MMNELKLSRVKDRDAPSWWTCLWADSDTLILKLTEWRYAKLLFSPTNYVILNENLLWYIALIISLIRLLQHCQLTMNSRRSKDKSRIKASTCDGRLLQKHTADCMQSTQTCTRWLKGLLHNIRAHSTHATQYNLLNETNDKFRWALITMLWYS